LKITVIGCGRWGSLIAWYLDSKGHSVTLYGRQESSNMQRFLTTRSNELLTLPDTIDLSTSLSDSLDSEILIISIGSQSLRRFLKDELAPLCIKNKIIVLCMKGLENTTGKRLSQIVEEELDASNKIAVWIGPGHVQEFYAGIPNCMVIDSKDEKVKQLLIESFSSNLIRFYYGQDLLGNEIGAASKNVIGIAAGFLDGLKLSSLKGALMSRGTQEISRLIKAMGGNPASAYGLCHLGDYEATVFSVYSHNRQFGEKFITNQPYKDLAEGYATTEALVLLSREYNVELPICNSVYQILYNNASPKDVMDNLFNRTLKKEF